MGYAQVGDPSVSLGKDWSFVASLESTKLGRRQGIHRPCSVGRGISTDVVKSGCGPLHRYFYHLQICNAIQYVHP